MANPTGDITVCGFHMSGVEWIQRLITDVVHNSGHGGHSQTACPRTVNACVHSKPSECVLETFLPPNKLVLVVRHPKDAAVASYIRGGYESSLDFQEFLSRFSLSSANDTVSWVEFYLLWDSAIKQMVPGQVHIVYFNDLVSDLRGEVKKICDFLNIIPDSNYLQQTTFTYSFDNIFTRDEPERKRRKTGQTVGQTDPILYEVDLWKNYFTVRQNDEFNRAFSHVFEHSNTLYDYDKLK